MRRILNSQVNRCPELGTWRVDLEDAAQAGQRGPGGFALHPHAGHQHPERNVDLPMESAMNPEILPDPAGQLAGRPLEEWNERL